MKSNDPDEGQHRARVDNITPLLVRPKAAWKMLGCGNTRGYELLAAGELDSFKDGSSRKITVESIHRYIERHLKD
jgi:excisionase family DNA binding protein